MTIRVKSYSIRPQVLLVALAALFGVWGFLPQTLPAGERPAPSPQHQQVALPPLNQDQRAVSAVDCSEVPCLAISFDDGPEPQITPRVLDVLARYHARASFFVMGVHAVKYPDLVRRIYSEGHEVGNHSWSHPDLTRTLPGEIEAQVSRTQDVVMAAGVPAPHLFRPPYGAVNDTVRAHVPLALAMWNVDPEDWREKDPAKILEHIEASAKPGAVIDMHDTHPQTVEALELTLKKFQGRYQFVTVSELFDIPSGQRGEFYGR